MLNVNVINTILNIASHAMTLGQLIQKAQKEHLRVEMEVFLAFLLQIDRSEILARSDEAVPLELLPVLQGAWVRLKEGYPVAYLTGSKEFYGLELMVNESALIPRDATERLVDYVLERTSQGSKVLELGTGAGAISLALKSEKPSLEIMATDLSEQALELARENAEHLNLDVNFIHSDLLSTVPDEDFEVLVTNLPYIGEEKNRFIAENVEAHEPHMALFGGFDGLALYEKLFKQIDEDEWSFKYILGEIGFTQGRGIEKLARDISPHYDFELFQDYEGLDRHFILTRK